MSRPFAAGAPLEHRGQYGWTPLARAVLSGLPWEVAALVAAGARVDVTLPDDTFPAFAHGRTLVDLARDDAQKSAALARGAGARPEARPRPRKRRRRPRRATRG